MLRACEAHMSPRIYPPSGSLLAEGEIRSWKRQVGVLNAEILLSCIASPGGTLYRVPAGDVVLPFSSSLTLREVMQPSITP